MNKLLVICGPTACGKSPISVEVARKLNAEVISADSMQIYKHMDIGTAKIMPDEMKGIAHYLVDEICPDGSYNVAAFKKQTEMLIAQITERGKLPIICGGTGFYINALLYNADFNEGGPDSDPDYRRILTEIARERGPEFLHIMLQEVDSVSASAIHINNTKRIMRALEYYHLYGFPISVHNKNQKAKHNSASYDAKIFVLHGDRQMLYDRINRRVDKMIKNGLINEVEKLLDMGYSADLTSMQGLGYKEIVKYIQGEYSLETAVELVKQGTRRFAKRQLTWFKHQLKDAVWIDIDEFADNRAIALQITTIYTKGGYYDHREVY